MSNSKAILTLLIFSVCLSSCSFFQNCEEGQGEVLEMELQLNDFSSLEISNRVEVIIEESSDQKITIQGQENIINLINKEVKGDKWHIDFKRCIRPTEPVRIVVQCNPLDEIHINGSGNVKSKSAITSNTLDLSISGSGEMDLTLATNELTTEISGSGSIRLKGSTKLNEIEINGSGEVLAERLKSDETEVEINGSGDVKIDVLYKLNVEINGSGDVYYFGNPSKVSSNVNGSGNLERLN